MGYPIEFIAIVPILKKILKDRGITYAELAGRLNMSEANIKKIMIAKDCSLRRLNQICEAIELPLLDLLDVIPKRPVRDVSLSAAQQTVLTSDEMNLLVYIKVAFENISPRQAKVDLKLSDVVFEKKMLSLENDGLLKKNAKGKLTKLAP